MLKKLFYAFLAGITIPVFCFSVSYYAVPANSQTMIGAFGVCRGVVNHSQTPPSPYAPTGLTIFIPTNTSLEWNTFIANPPPEINVLDCCAKLCN